LGPDDGFKALEALPFVFDAASASWQGRLRGEAVVNKGWLQNSAR
jgi:hypothetical protein